jgi:hypothetical protein
VAEHPRVSRRIAVGAYAICTHNRVFTSGAGVTVGNEIDLVHSAIRLEELAKVMIGGGKRKIPYKDIHGTSFAS